MEKSVWRVCIIEDEDDLRNIYSMKFRKSGFEVLEARDGEEGLNIVEANIPDIILLDIVLPKINGFDLLRRFKTEVKTKNIPVFILSNLGQELEVKQGLQLKAEKYFIKVHYTPEEIVEKVREFINANR